MSSNNSFGNSNEYFDWSIYDDQRFDVQAGMGASPPFPNTPRTWASPVMNAMEQLSLHPEYALDHVPPTSSAHEYISHDGIPMRPMRGFHTTESNLHRSLSSPATSGRRATQMTSRPGTPGMPHGNQAAPSTIGVVFLDEATQATIFSCHHEECADRTFARLPELKRHYCEQHALYRPAYWCAVADCPRSQQRGEKPFRRVDKCAEHLRRQHCWTST